MSNYTMACDMNVELGSDNSLLKHMMSRNGLDDPKQQCLQITIIQLTRHRQYAVRTQRLV